MAQSSTSRSRMRDSLGTTSNSNPPRHNLMGHLIALILLSATLTDFNLVNEARLTAQQKVAAACTAAQAPSIRKPDITTKWKRLPLHSHSIPPLSVNSGGEDVL